MMELGDDASSKKAAKRQVDTSVQAEADMFNFCDAFGGGVVPYRTRQVKEIVAFEMNLTRVGVDPL